MQYSINVVAFCLLYYLVSMKKMQKYQSIVSNFSFCTGYRMPCPGGCPEQYYDQVMAECWRYQAEQRPNFHSLLHTIDAIIKLL